MKLHRLYPTVFVILAGSIATLLSASPALGTPTWTGTTSGSWQNTTRWAGGLVGGSSEPSTTDSSGVIFSANTTAQTTILVSVDSGRNIGGDDQFSGQRR